MRHTAREQQTATILLRHLRATTTHCHRKARRETNHRSPPLFRTIPYLITLFTAHYYLPLIILGRGATHSYRFFFRSVLRSYILRRESDRVGQESDNRIIRASKSVLALKSARILHAASALRLVNVVGEGGVVPTYARGSNALTFPNIVSRDRGRRSEYATPRATLRETVARDSAAFSCA